MSRLVIGPGSDTNHLSAPDRRPPTILATRTIARRRRSSTEPTG